MTVYTATIYNKDGGQEVISLFAVVSISVAANATTGSAAHGMGLTPKVGNPNPSVDEGYNVRASADGTNVTVTLDAPVSQATTFTVVCLRS